MRSLGPHVGEGGMGRVSLEQPQPLATALWAASDTFLMGALWKEPGDRARRRAGGDTLG